MPLENLIRPFETPRVSPPKAAAVSAVQAAQTVQLSFGRNGTGKTMNGTYSSTVTSYCASADNESKRQGAL
jgi:hypothetical protein